VRRVFADAVYWVALAHPKDQWHQRAVAVSQQLGAVEVVTTEDYAGAIMGDLSSRRGRIEGMEHSAGSQGIKAIVQLAEMFGYATHMRSSTQGRAEYSMHFARYEEVPRSVADEIIGRSQGPKR